MIGVTFEEKNIARRVKVRGAVFNSSNFSVKYESQFYTTTRKTSGELCQRRKNDSPFFNEHIFMIRPYSNNSIFDLKVSALIAYLQYTRKFAFGEKIHTYWNSVHIMHTEKGIAVQRKLGYNVVRYIHVRRKRNAEQT